MIMKEQIKKLNNDVESVYKRLNEFISVEDLVEIAYPNLDGIADDNAIADMMLLRDNLSSLLKVTDKMVENLSRVIGIYEESE